MDLFAKPMDLLVIAVVAFLLLGPDRFPEMATKAGKALREFKAMAGGVTAEFQGPLQEMQATMDEMRATVTGVGEETRALASLVPTTDELHGMVIGPSPAAPAAGMVTLSGPVGPAAAPRMLSKADPLADFAHLDG